MDHQQHQLFGIKRLIAHWWMMLEIESHFYYKDTANGRAYIMLRVDDMGVMVGQVPLNDLRY